jgi:hypothetical protein
MKRLTQTIIFTEIFNCAEVGKVSLESFFKYHSERKIYVFGTREDFDLLGEEIKQNEKFISVEFSPDKNIEGKYSRGHEGSAYVFAYAFSTWKGRNVIHVDGDLVFKEESISLIENAFDEGFDIVGSRRCYGNNPVNIKGLDKYPDTVSTYFLGLNTEKMVDYDFETYCRMWQGAFHPLGYPVLDFGDGVTHSMLNNGAKIKYLDSNLIGGQDENGKKFNDYKSNLHLDCGKHLIHFGGCGSGCAVFNGKSSPVKSYADWAVIHYAFFCKLFFNKDILSDGQPPVFDIDGRWISGSWNEDILQQIKNDLK